MASTSALFSPAELTFAQVPLTHSAAAAHPDDEVPLRLDGRTPLQYRDLVLETGVSQAQGALGSAKVSIEDAAGAGGGGTTEVYAGVRGEIETMSEAAPSVKADLPIHLASLLASLFSPASLPPTLLSHLVVLPGSKAWTLYLDILILSSSGGNVSDLSIIAARSALAATRLPLTRSIGFDEAGAQSAGDGAGMTVDEGFSGLVKGGKAGVRAVDFELIDGGEQGVRLPGWEDLPVGITLNLINQLPHLDATVLEESATSSQLVASFLPSGAVCGITQLGEGEIEYARVLPLISEASKYALELMKGLNAKLKAA
ncbi:hypothetical protein Rhopal_006207-T1 [Rhodotorula paludigena]|uniref:Ribosomal RNA-processing protein 42 n=1 Tax=Rhodotorula paludigena TaxID=86838 RepID=A0AAV5GTC2_9BASI|nr:hypothetical protein Rhopal_006207-T1 [Rhodotorula paludigena]